MRPRRYRLYNFAGLLAFFAVLAFGWLHANNILDWLKLRDYTPPSAIASLATEDTMNSYTRRLFYVNHPQLIDNVSDFRANCPETPNVIVLGCYRSGLNGIYIFDVQEPELAGITQVTAAHEVLHAVYERLSNSEKTALNRQLADYYQHGLTDQKVIGEVKIYQQTEPNDVYDEMSCTFGTEIASLPPGLEAYYRQYFSNRQAVVAFEQQYSEVFTSKISQVDADNQKLSALKQQIDAEEGSLNVQLQQINTDRARLDSLRSSGNTAQYNEQVPVFNAEIESYNNGVANVKSDIDTYNSIINSDNGVVAQLDLLNKAIDTRTSPSPQSTQ